jgi:hypothetical protein
MSCRKKSKGQQNYYETQAAVVEVLGMLQQAFPKDAVLTFVCRIPHAPSGAADMVVTGETDIADLIERLKKLKKGSP